MLVLLGELVTVVCFVGGVVLDVVVVFDAGVVLRLVTDVIFDGVELAVLLVDFVDAKTVVFVVSFVSFCGLLDVPLCYYFPHLISISKRQEKYKLPVDHGELVASTLSRCANNGPKVAQFSLWMTLTPSGGESSVFDKFLSETNSMIMVDAWPLAIFLNLARIQLQIARKTLLPGKNKCQITRSVSSSVGLVKPCHPP